MVDWLSSYSVYLFDFDGVLIDSEPAHYAAYKKACFSFGYPISWSFDQYCSIAHHSAGALQRAMALEFPELKETTFWDLLYIEKKRIYQKLLREGQIELTKGASEFLRILAKRESLRAVATNSELSEVQAIKTHHPILNSIPLWITREDYQNPKPAPDAYLTAIKRLDHREGAIIGFEDSLRGIAALQGAGVDPVWLASATHRHKEEKILEGVPRFASFEELVEHTRFS